LRRHHAAKSSSGLALFSEVKVAALCDTDAATLERARQQTGITVTSTAMRTSSNATMSTL